MAPDRPPATATALDQIEKVLLGKIMLDSEAFLGLVPRLRESDFSVTPSAIVFRAIKTLHAAGYESGNLQSVVLQLARMETGGGGSAETEVGSLQPFVTAAAGSYERPDQAFATVIENSKRRAITEISDRMRSDASGVADPDSLVDRYAPELLAVGDRKSSAADNDTEILTLDTAVASWISELHEIHDVRAGSGLSGVSTGLASLDEQITGLAPGRVYVVAARPGVGKTALAMQLATQVAMGTDSDGNYTHSVLVFSIEMAANELAQRQMASLASVPLDAIAKVRVSPEQFAALHEASRTIAQIPLYIDATPKQTASNIRLKALRVNHELTRDKQPPLSLIVIDYVQMIDGDTNNGKSSYDKRSRTEVLGEISRALKILARNLGVPIIVLSQLNRGAEMNDEPKLSHLKDSGAIEQDADVVMLLHAASSDGTGDSTRVKISIPKNRFGAPGSLNLKFEGRYSRFVDADSFPSRGPAPVPLPSSGTSYEDDFYDDEDDFDAPPQTPLPPPVTETWT